MRAATGGRAADGPSPFGLLPWRPLAWRAHADRVPVGDSRTRHQQSHPVDVPLAATGRPATRDRGTRRVELRAVRTTARIRLDRGLWGNRGCRGAIDRGLVHHLPVVAARLRE